MSRTKYTEEEYREAATIWKLLNPTLEVIPQKTVITIFNGKKVPIGTRMNFMRQHPENLTEDQKEFWKDFGLFAKNISVKTKYLEEEYREAAHLWRALNPTAKVIPAKTKIIISSRKEIPIGTRMSYMRAHKDELTEDQKEFWSCFGLFEENISNKDKYTEEEYQEAAHLWRKDNPDIEMIPESTVITISNGKEIPVGKKLIWMRANLEILTEEQKHLWKEYGLFAKAQANKDKYTEEEYREAAHLWREDYPYLEMIPQKTVITIASEKEIPIGTRMSYMRTHLDSLTKEQKQFWMEYGLFAEGKNKTLVKETPLDEYRQLYKDDKDKEKRVIKLIRDIRNKRRTKRIENCYIEEILKKLNIDIETLHKYFCKISKKEPPEKQEEEFYKDKKLNTFCFIHNYDYEKISRVLRLYELGINDTLEGLTNRVIVMKEAKTIKKWAPWIYEKYGMMIEEMLSKLKLDEKTILKEMTSYQLTLEEAIGKEIFRNENEKKEDIWLQEVYEYLIDEIKVRNSQERIEETLTQALDNLEKEYHLTKEETEKLVILFLKYVDVIKEYQIIDVGLETDEERKIDKIKEYQLEPESIEESFFIPLEFDKNKLLGRRKELYMRRQILRQYIIDWDYYTQQEKEQIIIENQFTREEMNQIQKTREDINETIMKTKK